MIHPVKREGLGAGHRPAGNQPAGGEVIGPQLIATGYVEPLPSPSVRHRRIRPARLDEHVLDRRAELALRGHPIVAERDKAGRHGVLGQVRVGEFVDRVGLPVAPVLQELGGGAGVVDLVEVHPVRLGQAERAQTEAGHDDDHQEPQVQSVEPPAGLAVKPPRAIGHERTHGQPRGQPAQAGPVAQHGRQVTPGRGPGPGPGRGRLARIGPLRGRPFEFAGSLRPLPVGVDQRLRVELPDGSRSELRERPQEDGQQREGDDRDPAGRAQLLGQAQPVLHPGILVERVEQDRVQIGECADRQHQVGDPPAQGGRGEDRAEGEDGEHVALVDPGRHDEEGDGQDRQRDKQRAPIVDQRAERLRAVGVASAVRVLDQDRLDPAPAPCHGETDQHDDQQQQRRPHVDGGHAGDERGNLIRLRAERVARPRAVRRQTVAIVRDERPRVVGVDRQIWVAAGRLDHLLEQADQRQPERQAQHDRGAERDCGARGEADRTAAEAIEQPVRTRAGRLTELQRRGGRGGRVRGGEAGRGGGRGQGGQGRRRHRCGGPSGEPPVHEVAPDRDHHQDRDEDAKLRLDDRREDRQDRRSLDSPAPEFTQTEQEEHNPERVHLAPDRTVEPGDRVDHDDDGRQPGAAARTAELEHHRMDEPGQCDVGQDRRQLDQVADSAQRVADDAKQPQHVQVARRVVGKIAGSIEATRAVRGEVSGPGLKTAAIHPEAGARQQDVCDDEAEGESEGQDRDERPGGLERPRRCSRAPVGRARSGDYQGGPPPARALRWSGV